MIALELDDGRVLHFERDENQTSRPGQSKTPLRISGISIEDFNSSLSPKSGPDFIVTSKSNPNEIYVVEVKSGRSNPPIRQLEQATVQRAISQSMPTLRNNNLRIHRQFWIVNSEDLRLYVSEIGENETVTDWSVYTLKDVTNREIDDYSTDSIVDQQKSVSTASLLSRVGNWEQRINDLYDNIKEWAAEISPDFTSDTQTSVTMYEELMRRYAIPPRALPVLEIKQDGRVKLTLKPFGLWTIGGNGRLDLYSQNLSGFVIDRAEPFAEPIWQLYGIGERKIGGRKLRDGTKLDAVAIRSVLGG